MFELGTMEWVLTIISLAAVISSIWIGDKRKRLFLCLLIPSFALHLVFEGMRWQVGIVYLYIFLEIIELIRASVKDTKANAESKKKWKRSRVLWIAGFMLTFILISIMRYNEMDELNGTYDVGTFAFDVVDEERTEIYGETAGENRKIRLQVWYPAAYTEGLEKAKWLYDGREEAKGLPAYVNLPGFTLSYTSRLESNSYLEASISPNLEKYPLLIISHGWYGFRNLHTDVAEILASEGYIVICVEHTYGSLATIFDDGTVHFADPETLPSVEEEEAFAEAATILVNTYAEDIKFTLDIMDLVNQGELLIEESDDNEKLAMFEGRLDMDAIGLMGHSTGGGGVVKTAMTDERVDAVLGFDPWIEPIEEEYLSEGLATPSVFISSEQWKDRTNDEVLERLAKQENTMTLMYQLNDTYHQDFTMMYMFEPVAKIIGFTGDLDEEISREIQHRYALEFFDYYLQGRDNDLMNLDEMYDEVIENTWN